MPPNRIKRCDIPVSTDGSGNATAASTPICGEVLAIGYLKGTVNGATTATVSTTGATVVQTLDAYDVNGGNAVRYPRAVVLTGQAGDNKWCPFVVEDTVKVVVAGGAASKAFTVQIFYA